MSRTQVDDILAAIEDIQRAPMSPDPPLIVSRRFYEGLRDHYPDLFDDLSGRILAADPRAQALVAVRAAASAWPPTLDLRAWEAVIYGVPLSEPEPCWALASTDPVAGDPPVPRVVSQADLDALLGAGHVRLTHEKLLLVAVAPEPREAARG
jgi:hypothetical protein